MVEAAAKILDLPTEKNVLGQARRIDPKTVTQSYREIAREVHPDNGGSPQELAVASQARAILEDYSTMSSKDFRAKYNEPLMGANKVIKQLPAGEAPQSSVATLPEQGGYQSLFAEPKAVEVAPPVQAPTFEPPTESKAVATTTPQVETVKLYHATPSENLASIEANGLLPSKKSVLGEGTYFTTTPEKAQGYVESMKGQKNGSVITRQLDPNAKIFEYIPNENPTFSGRTPQEIALNEKIKEIRKTSGADKNSIAIPNAIKEAGYDGAKMGETTAIYNPSVISKIPESIKSASISEPSVKTESVSTSETKRSKVGKSIEAKAIEQGLASSFSESAQYDPITIKDQANRVSELMRTDMERAKRIVTGKEKLPDGMLGGSIIKAMEDHAMATGDAQLALEIANSPLTSATSIHAQEMRMLAERNPDSAVVALQRLKKIKEEAAIKKGAPKKERLVEQIQERIKKEKPKATKETWSSFIESVTC